jgi:hypothetical protein
MKWVAQVGIVSGMDFLPWGDEGTRYVALFAVEMARTLHSIGVRKRGS